ncbi:hypothetical protein ACI8AF_09905 [Blastococcus sp. SYSU D00669]
MVPKLGLEVSPALVTFGELLMLPFEAMESALEDELSVNPALERIDGDECPVCRGAWRASCPVCAPRGQRRPGTGSGDCDDIVVPADESDVEQLAREVRAEVGAADVAIADYVVASLDRHGMLDRSCTEMADELGVDTSRVERVLAVLRRTGPPGVGARTASECLLLQLDACGLTDESAGFARKVISDHLTALARGHFAAIAAALGASPAEVRGVLAFVRSRLSPYPAFVGSGHVTGYVVPDVVIRHDDVVPGAFTVELVEPAVMRVTVRDMWASGRVPADAVQRARSFVTQVRNRWQTLERVASCVVRHQPEFLRHGAAGLRPLTRAEVAAELRLHESTVSRAVADKYVLLPDRTTVPLARFFGGSGEVDEKLRVLLQSAAEPVSDQHLADQMRAAGYPIARRTVAKHRARLGFPATGLR